LFNAIISRATAENAILETGAYLALPDFQVTFTSDQQTAASALLAGVKAQPYAPPSVKQSLEQVEYLDQRRMTRREGDVRMLR
jgi:hypothetical protein